MALGADGAEARQGGDVVRKARDLILEQPLAASAFALCNVVLSKFERQRPLARGEPIAQIEQVAQTIAQGAAHVVPAKFAGKPAEVEDELDQSAADRRRQCPFKRGSIGIAGGGQRVDIAADPLPDRGRPPPRARPDCPTAGWSAACSH